MDKRVIFCCMFVLFMDNLIRTDGLPTDIAAKPGPCPDGPLQCLRCVRPEESTGPCGCPVCSDPCQGMMCPMCMPAETAAVRTSPTAAMNGCPGCSMCPSGVGGCVCPFATPPCGGALPPQIMMAGISSQTASNPVIVSPLWPPCCPRPNC